MQSYPVAPGNMKNNKIIFLIILGAVFGLFGGVVGFLLANSYLVGSSFGLPFLGEFSINQNASSGTNLIIRNAKKVVVEQDIKIKDTIDLAKSSLVGIYPQAKDFDGQLKTDLSYYYWLNQPAAEGLILTNDGWIITAWQPKTKETISKWVVVLAEKKVYNIDKIITDKNSGFSFIHIKASGLPVVQFSDRLNLAGNLAVVLKDWQTAAINYFSGIDKGGPIYSSDVLIRRLAFSAPVGKDYANGFVFDISGALVGLGKEGEFIHISALKPCLQSILREGKIIKPKMGLKYILLDELVANKKIEQNKGALVIEVDKKLLPLAVKTGQKLDLRAGDIILSLNGLEIFKQQDLSVVLNNCQADKKAVIEYLRGNEKRQVEISFSF